MQPSITWHCVWHDNYIDLWLRETSLISSSWFNSLAPGGFENIFQNVFFKLISWIDTLSNSCETALRSMPQNPSDDKSTLVQVMAWCRQAASHYLSQCCPKSLSPYGVTRPQWVNLGASVRFLRRPVDPRPATLLSGLQLQKRVSPVGRQHLYMLYWAEWSTAVNGYWRNKILFNRYTFNYDSNQH